MRIAVLGSTRGSLLEPLVTQMKTRMPESEFACVISNKAQSGILEKAAALDIPAKFCPVNTKNRALYDEGISEILSTYKIDLVVLLGYMRILSSPFVRQWKDKIINTHPSLLPAYAGLMDMAVHQAVIDAGEKESGCSVHLVTEELDSGPVLVQKKCPVFSNDKAEDLKKRVQALEVDALMDAIALFMS